MGQMGTTFSYNMSHGIPQGHMNYQLSEDPLPTGLCCTFHSLHFSFPTASSWLNPPSNILFQIRHALSPLPIRNTVCVAAFHQKITISCAIFFYRVVCKQGRLKAASHIACRAHAVPLPCRAARGLECVFPI